MKTTGGSINSQQIKVKTNSLQDTSGINVGFGVILPGQRSTSSPKKQSNSSRVEMVRQDPNRYHTFRLDHGLPGTTSAKPSTFSSLAYQCALSVIDPKRWYRYLLIISKPYHHPCRVHQRGTPSGRPRSAGKPQINSSNPISPANNNEINSSSACRQNARANSAPASPTLSESGMLEDQSEENIHRSCIVVEDGGDVDNVHTAASIPSHHPHDHRFESTPSQNNNRNNTDAHLTNNWHSHLIIDSGLFSSSEKHSPL
ncbi:hypothetical protein PSTG_08408 [Puccinia striiformis f. sp. tritici PST-78]|uniref:Uncharacterized protein n=1 Tax=Puccinia striiformis f. sp. tritici PST-78 TaxID=1165861 RepID=A0A0L0VGA9_9BASI|nr:hypothetical protein PSTG_08408 [Puccinia striiformis f. sp. tritici PST-78]